MKKSVFLGLIIGIAMAAAFSVLFISVLHSPAGIAIGVALDAASGVLASCSFKAYHKNKN